MIKGENEMGQRLRRRDLSCLKEGVRENGQIIEDIEKNTNTFRVGYGRRGRHGRRGMNRNRR